jgi:diguanylate cyclase (GGDEF)-like protein
MFFWSGGMAASAISALLLGNASGVAGLSMLLFVLYGVPLVFAVASSEQDPWHVRLVDGLLALSLGYLFFVHTFAFATMSGADANGVSKLRLMFDIENLFIALFALVRFSASTDRYKRAFFATLAIFAFAYLASAAYINHLATDTDYGTLIDLVIDLPFLMITALALQRQAHASQALKIPGEYERAVRAGSPLMLPATLLVVSGSLVRSNPGLAIAGFVAATLGYGLRNILVQMRGFDERDRLERLSTLDALTGLPNRRQFDECIGREWRRACRTGEGMALLMIDIDHFKMLNDSLGHPAGDRILRAVAHALAGCATRGSDLVARYGGEEFAAVLPSTSPTQAEALAEIMRSAIERLNLSSPAPSGRVTVSIGIGFAGRASEDSSTLVVVADAALYDAKQGGRNRASARSV